MSVVYSISLTYTMTEVLSVRVKKSLKDEAEKLGVNLRVAVEELLEELVAEKKAKAQKVAKELSTLMDVKPEEWVNDVRATRHEM
jgi:plasmid maintenance system antidote protein VapI